MTAVTPTVLPEDETVWLDVGKVVRAIVGASVLIGTILYAGRALERLDRLGDQIRDLSGAVNDLRITNVTVQGLVANQQALVAVDNDLRHQIEDLRVAVARLEQRNGEASRQRP